MAAPGDGMTAYDRLIIRFIRLAPFRGTWIVPSTVDRSQKVAFMAVLAYADDRIWQQWVC